MDSALYNLHESLLQAKHALALLELKAVSNKIHLEKQTDEHYKKIALFKIAKDALEIEEEKYRIERLEKLILEQEKK